MTRHDFFTAPYNRHRIRYQERNRKRHRRKYRKQHQNQQNFRHRSGCDGTCRNMFSCMFSGKKVDWDNHGTCPGMMDTCCTKWDPSRRPKKYIKSGRSLGPFPQVQVMSIFVQIYGSGLHIFGQKTGVGREVVVFLENLPRMVQSYILF